MRETILDAARRLIAAEGVAKLSIRAIAREIGYSPAALYEYFPAKEDVCRALFFEGAEGLTGMMERALAEVPAEAGPGAQLQALGRAYRGYALQNPELFRLVFTSAVVGFTPDAAELGRSRGGFDCLVETARQGVAAGVFTQLPPEVLATNCWSAVHGFVMLELTGMLHTKHADCGPTAISREELDELFEANLYLIGHGVMSR
jgi:AcrR family transcriptional regulator